MPSETRDPYDVLVIGGGINGTGIARDAAGRGLSVALCEQHDLGGATSSASSKLVHGGLRYLEHFAFGLVRESLRERELLLSAAPHLVRPRRFVLPVVPGRRRAWMLRLGLAVYDRLGGRSRLAPSEPIALPQSVLGEGLQPRFERGFAYSDGWVDDARLVVLNAVAADELGAHVWTRTRCVAVRRQGKLWRVVLRAQPIAADREERAGGESSRARDEGAVATLEAGAEAPQLSGPGSERIVFARALVNAAGPWARRVLGDVACLPTNRRLRLVRGSHIVVPRLYAGEHAFVLQSDDGRVVFVLPFEGRFSLVGTTEVDTSIDAVPRPGTGRVEASADEIDYLCRVASQFLEHEVFPDQVVWSYAGVRPLYDDGRTEATRTTRDYVLELDGGGNEAPLLSVFGGKLTTYRRLAERALDKLGPCFPRMGQAWTARARLPGGDIPVDVESYHRELMAHAYSDLPPAAIAPILARHGTRARLVLGDARSPDDLGRCFGGRDGGPALFEREVAWFCEREWARTGNDVLWRRTKMGLHLDPREQEALGACVERLVAQRAPALG